MITSNVVGDRPLRFDNVLMITARTIGGPPYPEMIEEIDNELTKVIEDFDRALYAEALRQANETSKLSFSPSVDS